MKHGLSKCISDYLWQGYLESLMPPAWLHEDLLRIEVPNSWRIEEASKLLDAVLDDACAGKQGCHVVPISGGLDSRIVLSALLDRYDAAEIKTYTFGQVGQLDYEIGARVAKIAGVEHYRINLSNMNFEWTHLQSAVTHSPWTFMPDAYVQQAAYAVARKSLEGRYLWSGFLGDPLTGGHYSSVDTDAGRTFANRQKRARRGTSIRHCSEPVYQAIKSYPGHPFSLMEWLDISVRQYACISKIILGGARWDSWSTQHLSRVSNLDIITPFTDRRWATYWLNMPRSLHYGQGFYRTIANEKYPRLFGIPTKSEHGVSNRLRPLRSLVRIRNGVANRLHNRFPWLAIRSGAMDNYLDYQKAFLTRRDFRDSMEHAIEVIGLFDMAIKSDAVNIWTEHKRRAADNSEALLLLLGLALNLSTHIDEGAKL